MTEFELDKLLRANDAVEPLPASFRGNVWRRIEAESTGRMGLGERLELVFSLLEMPRFAAAAIFIMTILGLGLGSQVSSEAQDLQADYVKAISPFGGTHE